MSGLVLVMDKGEGPTSFDVVRKVKRVFPGEKVGHAGSLDPFATGVLVVLLGKATKLFSKFVNFDKEYEATLMLGIVTSTGDSQGKILSKNDFSHLTQDNVRGAFLEFIGPSLQVPPMVSAIKYKGRRLYELARRGIEVKRAARPINIYELNISRMELPEVDFLVKCSKGTYIRRLGEEIGEKLCVGGYISRIRRTALGPFNIRDAVSLEDIHESNIRDWKP